MKRITFALVLLAIAISCAANSSVFPLGVYSYLGNKEFVYNNKDLFIAWMDSLSYNVNIMELFPEGTEGDGAVYSESHFSEVLSDMNLSGIDAIVTDRCWKPGYAHSTHALTKSNYVILQAEIKNETPIDNYPASADQYWYGSSYVKHREASNPYLPIEYAILRTGHSYGDNQSMGGTWACIPAADSIGYAYADLQSRWSVTPGNYPLVNNLFRVQNPIGNLTDDNCFYITYRIKLGALAGLPPGTPLLYFPIAGYKCPNGVWDTFVTAIPSLVTSTGGHVFNNGIMTYADYEDIGSPPDYFDVTAKLTYQQLISTGLMVSYKIASLNPRLFWYGNSELYLDYIEIEDSMHRELRLADDSFQIAVRNRVNHIEGLGTNVKGLYTYDEPTQAQFRSYKRIQDMMNSTSVLPMTAVNRRGSNFEKPDGSRYNHYTVFNAEAQPKVYMPDPYPVTGLVDWTANSVGNEHLQKGLDSMVKNVYDHVRRQCITDQYFYPVVQAFGNWDGAKWSDDFIRPPRASQKMLQYLPLCFGADGIFNYRLYGYHSSDGSGDYCALQTPLPPTLPTVDHDTYDVLKDCNPRVLKYGELLSHPGIEWDGAVTLGTGGIDAVNPDCVLNLAEYKLSNIQLGQEQSTSYKGYVQIGFFGSNNELSYLMLVNRRSNYFESSPAYLPVISSANLVAPNSNFQSYFPEFPSQSIRFTPDNGATETYGTNIAMYDPYDNTITLSQQGVVEIDMGPGEGKLLQMISTLPDIVNTVVRIASKGILAGEIVLEEGGIVNVEAGTELTIKANSHITIHSGASFTFRGVVSIEDNVTISVLDDGAVNFDNAVCTWGESSILKVTGGTLSISGGSLGTESTSRWAGIRVSDSSQVLLDNATISNAMTNHIKDSDCTLNNCRFNVPTNSSGLKIENTSSGYTTEISNTMPGKGFYGTSDQGFMGICLLSIHNPVNIQNVDFHGLEVGIQKEGTPYATDTVNECDFVNCKTGINLLTFLTCATHYPTTK